MRNVGSDALTATFRRVADWFSDVAEYEWELVASGVSGDSAHTVGIEPFPHLSTASLRSTSRFGALTSSAGREGDGWRCIAMPTVSRLNSSLRTAVKKRGAHAGGRPLTAPATSASFERSPLRNATRPAA